MRVRGSLRLSQILSESILHMLLKTLSCNTVGIFIETDSEGNGILRRRDVKNALYGFDIPLTPREFEKLWMR